MIPTCPRCESIDVHSSRSKGPLDAIARALGMPPRRCSACGWRGYRPRPLFPARHGSNPELPAVPEPASASPEKAEPQQHHHHRHHHHVKPSRPIRILKMVLLAAALGTLLGYLVCTMGD